MDRAKLAGVELDRAFGLRTGPTPQGRQIGLARGSQFLEVHPVVGAILDREQRAKRGEFAGGNLQGTAAPHTTQIELVPALVQAQQMREQFSGDFFGITIIGHDRVMLDCQLVIGFMTAFGQVQRSAADHPSPHGPRLPQ